MVKRLEYGVLGPLQMTADGAPLPLGTPKQRAVLAMLVMSRNRPVGSDALVNAAWEQFPPPEPKASLHSYVSNLRKLVSTAGLDPKAVLASAPPGYRLAIIDADCDIGRFIAEKNAGVQAAAASQFEQASREPLNVRKAALTTAVHKVNSIDVRTAVGSHTPVAFLRFASGASHPLTAVATRIGRLPDNEIVLDDVNVSRHHAVIIDTGTSFVITDLRSANGVEVGDQRIRGTATLGDGDVIRICDHQFTLEIGAPEPR